MAKIRCRGCGKMIDERETSCPYCGKRTGGSRTVLTKKKRRRSPAPLIAICALILIIAAAAVVIVIRINAGKDTPQIETYDDGTRKETILNSDGLPKSYVRYDADGAETERGEYVYKNGSIVSETVTFADGSSYTAEFSDGIAVSQIWYSRDGSRQEDTSDASGNLLSSVIYDKDGTVTGQEDYEYLSDGTLSDKKLSHSDGSYEEYEYAEDGSLLACVIMNVDGSGCRDEYDENGSIVKEIIYYIDGTSEESIPDKVSQ